ncbi:MAG TPA: winged helix-turn-helix domain-containing protein [Acidobacteriaceae bacterium]|nr:winged helix-turn-helix domain-containing protein [Acidobacteriaceae bacterium]
MAGQMKHLLEFGPFHVDPERRLLLRGHEPVAVSPKAFDLLLVLLERSGQVVSKDDLMSLLWPDSFVEESNLGQHVFQLRKALGERPQDHTYIVTVPGRGYWFAERVNTIQADAPVDEEIEVRSHSTQRIVIREEMAPATDLTLPPLRRPVRPAIIVVGLALVILAAVLFRPFVPAPKVIRIRQLTHLGTLVYNATAVTDGPRIYFRVWEGQDRVLHYISAEGGEVLSLQPAIPEMDIYDIAPRGNEFLAGDLTGAAGSNDPYTHRLWRVPIGPGSPRPLGNVKGRDARWSPDGSTVVYTVDSDLRLINGDGTNPRNLESTAGLPFYPQWSPDGRRIRYSVADMRGEGLALWEADVGSEKARPVLPDWPISMRPAAGRWSPDGRYFFFTAVSDETRDIWAMREPGRALRRIDTRPVRLTTGPMDFFRPMLSKDGKSILAIGQQLRGALMRYDRTSRIYVPYARGISVDHVAFSRDGQWMAYVEFPQRVLLRARLDGSEPRQLTFPPMQVSHPQWSPDGSQLAFQASADASAPPKIYLVSRDGGLCIPATHERRERQTYPSWSAQGDSILYSGADETEAHAALYRVDLNSRQVSGLPGTADLYWGQVSPDGRHIVALTDTTQHLVLYDMISHATRTLAGLADYPVWFGNGRYIYFSTLFFRRPDSGIFRWQLATGRLDKVAGPPDFPLGGIWGVWFGLTPDGDPLVVRNMSSTDLYALDVKLP